MNKHDRTVDAGSGPSTVRGQHAGLAFCRGQPREAGRLLRGRVEGCFSHELGTADVPHRRRRGGGEPPGDRGTLRMDGAPGCPLRRRRWLRLRGRANCPRTFGTCLRRSSIA